VGAPLPYGAQLEALNEIARIATDDLELRPMLQRITDALSRRFGWEFVACVSVDGARGRFVCEALTSRGPSNVHVGYTRPLGSGVVGEVALTGLPIVLDDVRTAANFVDTMEGTLSELCVPVRHGGRTVAIINAESRKLGAFRGQLPLLETVAEQVAGAIASARAYADAQHRARLLEMVGEVSRVAMEAGELGALLGDVVKYVQAHFPLAFASILLADDGHRSVLHAAHAGEVELLIARGQRLDGGEGIVGRCLRTGEPQLVLDVRADPDYVPASTEVEAEFALPVRYRGRILGIMNLEARSAAVFTDENVTVFRTFADQLAGAIHMASVNRELEEANERLRQANARLERLSMTDGLTEIANRRHFDDALALEWRRSTRAETPLSVVMLDLDHFKAYNDGYGHHLGDECLKRVARALRTAVRRAGDVVARYGGEEFVLLLPDTDAARAARFAERLRAKLEAMAVPHGHSPVSPVVTASFGVATAHPQRGVRPQTVVEAADRQLYEAKRAGRNRVCAGCEPPAEG
jgi:diguanylate cyclase (GGDEF)-like protein